MKKINVLLLFVIAATAGLFAQDNEATRYIEVNGTAEIEIVPDEIYIVGALREGKTGDLEKTESAFLKAVKKLGISNENISLADLSGEYASAWLKKDQLVKEKIYQVKISSAQQLGNFLSMADETGLKNVQITRTDISNRNEVEQELRIKAVIDAKNKAQYMTEAIGSNIGEVQQIRENYITVYRGNVRVNDLKIARMEISGGPKAEPESIVGFKKIRMEVKVMARFEIIN